MEWIFPLRGILLWISLLCLFDIHVSGQNCRGKEPVIDPPALVVKYGGPATATCHTEYNADLIGWEATVGDTSKENTQQLVWSVASVTDWSLQSGITCYANSEYGQCLTLLPVTIYKMPENVDFVILNAGPLEEGHEYLLECEVQSVAPLIKLTDNLTVIWFRGVTELKRSGYSQFTINGDQSQNVTVRTNLSITASTEDHRASYSCAAHLDLDTAATIPDTRSNSILLEVLYKPRVLNSTGNTTVGVGDKLELSCTADANPSPSFQWKHNGLVLAGNNNNTLLIDSVTVDNEGVYECIIKNSQGQVSAKMDVKVEKKGNPVGIIIGVVLVVMVLVILGVVIYKKYF
ncbi:carcinoembryonic antigen-related cell adhesion molecule 5-like [Alosa alosa]|uniref:carcinoembryonic antigen-related cell adhesion molecule 5-like n=1 Tax=Alosa alosa TaxID=278164 RepID=UPI00201535C2|nr:carcinoembryonic antigen-related cell adhesion molecule 5-like [Alosa alosa]